MGGSNSNLVPAYPDFEYMSIMAYYTDTLRIIYGTTREIDIVRQSIVECWSGGIQREEIRFGSTYEFKLNGNPFRTVTALQDAIACRKLTCMILQRLHNAGWEHFVSSDLTREIDHMNWFFRRNHSLSTIQYPLICIGISSHDSLHVINASSAIKELIKISISRAWPKGIQNIKHENDTMVIKLSGYPWYGNGEESVYSRLLIQHFINDLHLQQWVLHTSSNIKSSADSIFFRYDPSVTPGLLTGNFALSLNQTDRLRVLGATADLVDAVRQAIQTYWSGGIQQERDYAGSWEFKLKGNPWWASGAEAVSSRLLILRILEMYATRGWMISATIDTSRKINDKSMLVFQRCNPMQVPIFCLSLNETDKIRLINAPQDIIQACRDVISSKWLQGIKEEKEYAGSHQFKLNGFPWCGNYLSHNHDGTHARAMLCFMFQAFASRNWRLLASADVSAKYVHRDKGEDYPIDVDSLYFIYDANLSASAPTTGFSSSFMPPPSYEFATKY